MIQYCYHFNIVVNDNIKKAVISACHIISFKVLQPNITFKLQSVKPLTVFITRQVCLHNLRLRASYTRDITLSQKWQMK